MQEYLPKIKTYALYLFAAVGILAALFFLTTFASPYTSLWPDTPRSVGEDFNDYGAAPSYRSQDAVPAPSAANPGTQREFDQAAESTERKVVKTGELSLLVKKAEEAAEKIKNIANELGGFVADANVYDVSDASKSGAVEIRVPADKFDEALKRIRAVAVKVEKEDINAEDVTEEFVDLEARLKSSKAEEAQYLKIMGQASKVGDILDVAERLSDVRSRIERLEGKIKFLSRQIDMSSIAVSLTEEADVELFGIRWRPLFTLKQAFRDMLEGLSDYIDALVGFVFYLPVLVLWLATSVAVLWTAWKAFRFVRAKFFSS